MIQITAPDFVAGLETKAGRVVRTAPIVKYMLGWSVARVTRYAIGKGWKVRVGI